MKPTSSLMKSFGRAALLAGAVVAGNAVPADAQTVVITRPPANCRMMDSTEAADPAIPASTPLVAFQKELQSYSGWEDIRQRFAQNGFPVLAVCMVFDEAKAPARASFSSPGPSIGTIDLNYFKKPDPEKANASFDFSSPHHLSAAEVVDDIGSLTSQALYYATMRSVAPDDKTLDPGYTLHDNAYINALYTARGWIGQTLSAAEHYARTGDRRGLETVYGEYGEELKVRLAALEEKITEARARGETAIPAAARDAFRLDVARLVLGAPAVRANAAKNVDAVLHGLLEKNANMLDYFNHFLPEGAAAGAAKTMLGDEIGAAADWFSLYNDAWIGNPADPAKPVLDELDEIKKQYEAKPNVRVASYKVSPAPLP